MKDYFSKQSEDYAKFRPVYPVQLFDHILEFVNHRKLAWDCGTGNGQTAATLAGYFQNVYATDISANQVSHAIKKNNIRY
ncbi:MAG TPA: methyltransferase domain-containing protein, partial [Ferruginibacter sp.]|nr:methyltransferase domain-containing protein [Ferruginibacter sp.]